jgi:hypothetical protein
LLIVGLLGTTKHINASDDISKNDDSLYNNYDGFEKLGLLTTISDNQVLHGNKVYVSIVFNTRKSKYLFEYNDDSFVCSIKSGTLITDSLDGFYVNALDHSLSTFVITISNNDSYYKISIYVDSVSSFDYFSNISLTSAMELRFNYLLSEKFYTEDDRQNFLYGDSITSTVNEVFDDTSEVKSSPSGNITIRGHVYWIDDNNVTRPAVGVKVEICTLSFGSSGFALASIYTNSAGYYNTVLPYLGLSIFRKIYPSGENFTVADASGNPYELNSKLLDLIVNMTSGTISDIDYSINMVHPLGQAFQIHQVIYYSMNYSINILGGTTLLTNLKINYPQPETYKLGGDYNLSNNTISLQDKYYDLWDAIMHEFGHYLGHMIGFLGSNIGGQHNYYDSLLDYKWSEGGVQKTRTKIQAIETAWSEGWATWFVIACQLDNNLSNLGINGVGDKNIDFSHSTPVNYEDVYPYIRKGEAGEGTITAFLLDLADSENEGAHDSLSIGYTYIFDILISYQPINLSSFVLAIVNEGINQVNLGSLLSYYEIAPFNILVSYVNNATGPTISWDLGGGSFIPSKNNNYFYVEIKNIQGNTLLYYSGTSAYYQILNSTWTSFINNTSSPYLTVTIKGYQISSPITGAYVSETIIIEKIHSHNFSSWAGIPSSHYHTCSICSLIEYCPYESVLNNHPTSQHLWSCVCGYSKAEDHTYVNGVCSVCGHTQVHTHSYTDHYVDYSSTQHKAYCACGTYSLKAHIGFGMEPGEPVYCVYCNHNMGTGGGGHFLALPPEDNYEKEEELL